MAAAPSLPPVSEQRKLELSRELIQALSFSQIGEKTCCVCDQLTPARDMKNQHTLTSPFQANGM
jgi:hypothetical protein